MNKERMLQGKELEQAIDIAARIFELFRTGQYKKAMLLEMELFGLTKEEVIVQCKRSRVESRHQHFIAAAGGPKPEDHWHSPWCRCGWSSNQRVKTYEEAKKIKCPNRLRQLANYRLPDKED